MKRMKPALLLIVAALFLLGCPKRIPPANPIIETKPPQYIWLCLKHADGTIVCDAVPRLEDVPNGYNCIQQENGIVACWPVE